MKIGNTQAGLRVALTTNEFKMLGSPTRVALRYLSESKQLSMVGNPRGPSASVFDRNNDATHPYSISFGKEHPWGRLQTLFGTEVVNGAAKLGDNELLFPLPTQSFPVQRRSAKPKGPLVKSSAPVPTEELHSLTLDAAVDLINTRKTLKGANLILSIDDDGFLEVMQRSGK